MRFIHSINTKEYVKMGNICCLAYFPFLNKNPSIFYIFANNNLISKVCMNLYFLSQLIALFSLFLEKAESASTPVVWTASPYFVTGKIIIYFRSLLIYSVCLRTDCRQRLMHLQ